MLLDDIPEVAVPHPNEMPVKIDEETEDLVIKNKAYELFLNTAMSPQEIGMETGVQAKQVLRWIRRNGWIERKKQMDEQLQAQAEDAYRKRRRFLIDNQLAVATRHLSVSEKIERAIEELVNTATENGAIDSMLLQRVSKALSDVTSVSSRAVGLDSADSTLGKKELDERKPLLVLNFGSPQVSEAKDITDQVTVNDARN